MAPDRIDVVAVCGLLGFAIGSQLVTLEAFVLAAGLGGFTLSLAVWRLYDGRVWEAFGWLAWVGAAVVIAFGPAGQPGLILAFLSAVIIGIGFLVGGRSGRLPDVWTVTEE